MSDGVIVETGEVELALGQARSKRIIWISAALGTLAAPALALGAMVVANALTSTSWLQLVITPVVVFVISVPFTILLLRRNVVEGDANYRVLSKLSAQLAAAVRTANDEAGERRVQTRRQAFESRLANALDMAEGEPEVIHVIERSFAKTLPDSPVELLLADNSHAHLLPMATSSPDGTAPGCSVDSPDHCPAARRAQTQHFVDSDDLDACPKLRGRAAGALSAVCVPVSIMGRTVGVIHATAPPHQPVSVDTVDDMGTLAKLAGARIGLLRVMAETQLQASTDSLTGLLNRRSFEQRVAELRRSTPMVSLAMADLDHFKILNDTFGHETGDRALRLFAQVMSGSVRAQDLVGRHGGEEFVIALIGCTAQSSGEILNSLRARLDAAITVAGMPKFTVSIGVVEARADEDFPALAGRADAALFQAKNDGRDRVVVRNSFGNPVDIAPDASRVLEPASRGPLTAADVTVDN